MPEIKEMLTVYTGAKKTTSALGWIVTRAGKLVMWVGGVAAAASVLWYQFLHSGKMPP
jgi:ATP:corrinoid adenosyltransferase